jgi:hypothetical protein
MTLHAPKATSQPGARAALATIREIECPFIIFMEGEHKYATVDDLYGKSLHPSSKSFHIGPTAESRLEVHLNTHGGGRGGGALWEGP